MIIRVRYRIQEECLYIEAARLPSNSLDPCNSSDPITERFAHVEGYEVCDEAFKLSEFITLSFRSE